MSIKFIIFYNKNIFFYLITVIISNKLCRMHVKITLFLPCSVFVLTFVKFIIDFIIRWWYS